MTDARKNRKTPAPIPAAADETRRTNVLLEDIQKRVMRLETMLDAPAVTLKSLAPLPDEIKSLADRLRGVETEIFWMKTSVTHASQDLEAVKTELRLIRSDLNASAKRLTEVETRLVP